MINPQQEQFEELSKQFAEFGYLLQFTPSEENFYAVVRETPRRVLWRTRASHVLYALLATIKMERGLV